MTRSPVPSVPLFGPAYLAAEIEELQKLAKQAYLGTLDYLLEMAVMEARLQAKLQAEGRSDAPDAERWRPPPS